MRFVSACCSGVGVAPPDGAPTARTMICPPPPPSVGGWSIRLMRPPPLKPALRYTLIVPMLASTLRIMYLSGSSIASSNSFSLVVPAAFVRSVRPVAVTDFTAATLSSPPSAAFMSASTLFTSPAWPITTDGTASIATTITFMTLRIESLR